MPKQCLLIMRSLFLDDSLSGEWGNWNSSTYSKLVICVFDAVFPFAQHIHKNVQLLLQIGPAMHVLLSVYILFHKQPIQPTKK